MRVWIAMLVGLMVCPAMSSAHEGHKHKTTARQKPWAPRKDASGVYGTKTKQKATKVTVTELFKNPAKYKGKMVRVAGTIGAVCQVKGCWMMLKSGDRKMRIRFKGYKFFLPTNSKGYKAVAVGYAKKRTIPVHVLRHYAKDRGDHEAAKKITKPKVTVAFTASWVTLSQAKAPAKKAPAKKKTSKN